MAATTSPLRQAVSVGQVIRVPGWRLNEGVEADPDWPYLVIESMSSGDLHVSYNLGREFSPVEGEDPIQVSAELWILGDQVLIEAQGFEMVEDLLPRRYFGLFGPGVGAVDLASTSATRDDLLSLLVQYAVPDFGVVAERLPMVLPDLRKIKVDPPTFSGHATTADLAWALGDDVVVRVPNLVGDLAALPGVDLDDVARFVDDYLADLEHYVQVVLRDDGTVESMWVVSSVAGFYEALLDPQSGVEIAISAQELEEARSGLQFGGSSLKADKIVTFEFDDTIVVVPPSGDAEDRTDELIAHLADLDG